MTLQAQQPPGPEVEFAEAPDEAAEAAGIADWLARAGRGRRQLSGDGGAVPDQRPVAGRSSRRWPTGAFPYLVRGGERFYERPEVRQALLTLRNRGPRGRGLIGHGGQRDRAGQGGARRAGLDRRSRPRVPARCANAGSRWPPWSAWPRTWPGRRDDPADRLDLPAISAELDRRAEAQHVPAAQGVTVGDPALGQGPGMGRGRAARRPRGLAAVRARHLARAGRTRSAGCSTSGSPGPAGCCGSPGRAPATAAATPASRRGSWTSVLPGRPGAPGRPPGRVAAGRAARCCRPTAGPAASR